MWSNRQNLLTNETLCHWVQGYKGGIYGKNNDGTVVQSLNQSENVIIGTIPDNIGLLMSLTGIDLNFNKISGTQPTELDSLFALT